MIEPRHEHTRVELGYSVTLYCGCRLRVSRTRDRQGQTRTIQRKHPRCVHARHAEGARLFLWDMLPPRSPDVEFNWL